MDTEKNSQPKPQRDDKGRLVKGARLSPGRPAGTSAIERFRQLVGDDWAAVVRAMVDAAKSGDVKAAELVAARMVPPARPASERVEVPGMREAATLADKCSAVLAAIACGQISADAGRAVLGALSDAARVLEVSHLASEVEKLKALLKAGRKPRILEADDGSDLV